LPAIRAPESHSEEAAFSAERDFRSLLAKGKVKL
jgi:hypothetical protein